MSEHLEPALEPFEWRERKVWNRDTAWCTPDSVPGYFAFDCNAVGITPYVFEAHKVMALANTALPDGHAGKITWADVEALSLLAITGGVLTNPTPETQAALERAWSLLPEVAAKLAALLPPRGEM